MISVTCDTNVYVAALHFGGSNARLLGIASAGLIRLDASEPILDEVIEVLRDDFGWQGYRLHFVRREMMRIANVVIPKRMLSVVKDDPDDDRILECAATAGSDYLVSADRHLLKLGSFEGIQIIPVHRFLDLGIRWK